VATVIQFKRSSSSSGVPTASDLSLGEIAINSYHGRLYTKSDDGVNPASVVEVGTNPTTLTVNNAFTFPTSDGSVNQVLTTNGSGTVSWQDSTEGGASGLITYNYSISTTTDTITGADDNNKTLSFVPGSEQVYLNGVKLVGGGSDYTTSGSDTITLAEDVVSGDSVEVIAYTAGIALIQGEIQNANFTTTTADQVLTTIDMSAYKSTKFIINAEDDTTGDRHASEVLLTHDGTNSFFVQYGDVWTDVELFSIDSDTVSGNARLLITPTVSGLTVDVFEMKHT
jgi:hypothetical protein